MMKNMTKRLLSAVVALMLILALVPAAAMAEEATLPEATVTAMDPVTLTAEEHDYMVWPSGDDTVDRPLEVVVKFKAEDTLEECLAGGYADWLVDFNLIITGTANGSVAVDNCYLAGNYGSFGWIVIPTDGLVLEEGVRNPVVAGYDATLNYTDICNSVKEFIAAIHVDQAIWDANPDMQIQLDLVMTNPADEDDKLFVGEPIVYTASGLVGSDLPKATVTPEASMVLAEDEHRVWYGLTDGDTLGNNTLYAGDMDRPLEVVVNFKAQDTLEECLAGKYAKWLVDFNIRLDGLESGSIVGDECYMAGNYGTYGWIAIPLDGIEFEEGVTYPVVALYDPTLNYKDICKSVKDFTAALHIDRNILNANKDLTVTLSLVMTNPEDPTDTLTIGEPLVYGFDALVGGAVCENTTTGYIYSDLSDGVDACAAGQTVRLLADVTENNYVIIGADEALDLNGKTLTLESNLIALSNTSLLVDSTNGDGLVKANVGQVTFAAHDTYAADGVACVPTWIEEDAGFRLAPVKFRAVVNPLGDGKAKVRFYFENNGEKGEETATLIANELKDGKADNDGLKMYVRVNYTYNGSQQYTDVIINDENMVKFGEQWKQSTVNVTFGGLDGVENVTFDVVIAGQDAGLAYTGNLAYSPAA